MVVLTSVKGPLVFTAGFPSRLHSTVASMARVIVPLGVKVRRPVPVIRLWLLQYVTAS